MRITCSLLTQQRKFQVSRVFLRITNLSVNLRFVLDLESEMYQLSHILIDQKNILATLREELVMDQKNVIEEQDPEDDEEQQNKKAIAAIKESLSGFDGILDGKVFINEGGLIELDSSDYRPIVRVHLFLFNDTLIIAKIKHDK